ncbi:histidinol-phosphate transaminase [Fodinibius sediminis]|uniref:Histidinol-phosphate aminotransferase n=1 Tax=Fodinibius sediminis TaxID=1214077 RepID=A0A521BXL3_9BACT|nr:histidinol-phosphate transaminase [Fodinibius sediminis]SMO51775.1 histidinol-phosphate aminotransferase [Fodinibius sediminis]
MKKEAMSTSFNLEKLVRPNIQALKPYHSARQDFSEGLLLDANENSYGDPIRSSQELHRYPSPTHPRLRKRIAQWRRVRPENVFIGVGSDEGIDLLYRIFCTPGQDRILTTPPTYGMYRVSANIHDIAIDEVLLTKDHFQPQVDQILKAVTDHTKILLLCSPNNPTGNTFERDRMRELIESFPGIVVVDEAYIDFSDEESWASEVNTYPNLVVLQTLSKSFGLAGIRLGITFASDAIIDYMMKVKAPYNVNKLTAQRALEAFDKMDRIASNIAKIKKQRSTLRQQLEQIAIVRHIYPSEANFLLVRVDHARKIYQKLADRGIIVRYRGNEPHCDDTLRITVGTPEENERLISALKQLTE